MEQYFSFSLSKSEFKKLQGVWSWAIKQLWTSPASLMSLDELSHEVVRIKWVMAATIIESSNWRVSAFCSSELNDYSLSTRKGKQMDRYWASVVCQTLDPALSHTINTHNDPALSPFYRWENRPREAEWFSQVHTSKKLCFYHLPCVCQLLVLLLMS